MAGVQTGNVVLGQAIVNVGTTWGTQVTVQTANNLVINLFFSKHKWASADELFAAIVAALVNIPADANLPDVVGRGF